MSKISRMRSNKYRGRAKEKEKEMGREKGENRTRAKMGSELE